MGVAYQTDIQDVAAGRGDRSHGGKIHDRGSGAFNRLRSAISISLSLYERAMLLVGAAYGCRCTNFMRIGEFSQAAEPQATDLIHIIFIGTVSAYRRRTVADESSCQR